MDAYCVVCKEKKTNVKVISTTTTAKGVPLNKGKCPKCGTTVCRLGKAV